jgi:CheY-specific phosphatase CheX
LKEGVGMENLETACQAGQPLSGELREQLLEPFIAGVRAALGEMAQTEPVVRAVCRTTLPRPVGDIAAVVGLSSATGGSLIFGYPHRTAATLTRQVLSGLTEVVDESLIRDCVGEIANVAAGQAKALLAETPYRLTFSLPRVLDTHDPELCLSQRLNCLLVIFGSDAGEFALHLALQLETAGSTAPASC